MVEVEKVCRDLQMLVKTISNVNISKKISIKLLLLSLLNLDFNMSRSICLYLQESFPNGATSP